MKQTVFILSLSLLAISNTLLGAYQTNTEATIQAKKIASAPSSSTQEPFKKLDTQETAPEELREEETSTPTKTQEVSRDPFELYDQSYDQSFAAITQSIQDEMNNLHDIVRTVQPAQTESMTSCAYCGHHKNTSSPITHTAIPSIQEKYSIRERVKKDVNNQNLYEITIGIPGYTTDDITVKFHHMKRKDKSGKTLEIYAKKQESQEQPDKQVEEKSKKKRAHLDTKTSHQFMSTTNINGKKRELFYKDGVLKIVLDLPEDVSDDYYSMSLENDVLKICLRKSSDTQETKVLEFN